MKAAALYTEALAIGYASVRQPDVTLAADLNLSLRSGELVCLLGPNGAGKSTLMRTLGGMQKALAGRVVLAGDDIRELKPRELATRLSVVLTDRPNTGLLNGYALVALGRHPHNDMIGRLSPYDEAMVRWAVDAVGATELAERPVMELSDGQRQKLMIARALAQESAVMLLDEPTAFLDLPRRVEIMRLLRQLARDTDRAILLSTHDLDLALRSADKLWLMAGGAVQVGTPESLVLNGAFEAAFLSEGVTFDPLTGSFSMQDVVRGTVKVAGEGVVPTWTRRAVQRAGFALVHNGTPPDVEIEISGDESHPVWRVREGDKVKVYESIDAVLAALGQ